jgi:glycosyltransferase involved in cell wall biosynthesis
MDRPLRVALVLPYYDPRLGDDPAVVLARQPTLSGIAEAEAARGLAVGAFQLFPRRATLEHRGARFTFLPTAPPVQLAARLAYRAFPRYQPPYYEPAQAVMRAAQAWLPDVLHVFGATLDLNLLLAARLARRSQVPLVVHYHGGLPDADRVTRALRHHNLAAAARVLFTSREQAEPWVQAGFLRPAQVTEAAETSTALRPLPRAQARQLTGMRGEPCCLMVGRLQPVKDPLTTLAGFAIVAERRPLARLYVYSLSDDLRAAGEAIVAAMPALQGRVEFRGAAAAAMMPAIYSSADVLLQASRREWSGLAVLEAMACGTIPVVTDIPPFRRLTDGGGAGRLFAVGDARALADAVLALSPPVRVELGRVVRRTFEESLSFAALARDLEAIYVDVATRSGSGRPGGRPRRDVPPPEAGAAADDPPSTWRSL